jgi:hypothetical protein
MIEWLLGLNVRITDATLLLFLLLVVWSVYKAHRNRAFLQFNLLDLLMEGGRMSKLACAFWIGIAAMTWGFVRMILDGKMTDVTYGLYASAVVGPVVAKLFSPAPLYANAPVKERLENEPTLRHAQADVPHAEHADAGNRTA